MKSLSGYLPVDGGGAIEFSLVLNATGTLTDQSVYRPIWDAFADMLATYPAGPTPRLSSQPGDARSCATWPRRHAGRMLRRTRRGRSVGLVAVMPMFPLGSVLLPGGVLPLHVFEPRYRQLVIDCLADDSGDPEFGVTLIERGWEVGGGDQRADVGVVARMVQVEALDDGRYAVVAVGTRRIRVNAWLPDDPYPLADVDDWPDEAPDDAALRRRRRRPDRPAAGGARRWPPSSARRRARSTSARSATTRCWRRTTSPRCRRSARPTATACCAPGHRPSGWTCWPRASTTSRPCCASASAERRDRSGVPRVDARRCVIEPAP